MTYQNEKISIKDLIFITIGCSLYAFGLVTVNIANNLAEGGATGITLIIRYWLHIDPAYSIILLNIPLIWIGYRYLGKKALNIYYLRNYHVINLDLALAKDSY